jgi:exopolyphosphatase/guanosine-5'-triphosphate,3'-diphosphate pyrophosphatase
MVRSAVVDLGSNSVRLVVFEGRGRNPLSVLNEKAVLRLGRGLQTTGRLDELGMAQALPVLTRYRALARAMGAAPIEVLATAAVRDAVNGPEFIAAIRERLPDLPIRVLSGREEAILSAEGVVSGIPAADGILADIGGGSLELVRLEAGEPGAAATLPLGVIRLAERAEQDVVRARAITEAELADVPWLAGGNGRDLYLVGGAWRSLARIHMAQTGYPLPIVHHYTVDRDEARDLAGVIAGAGRRGLERLPGVARRRVDDLPYAAVVLRRLLRATGARRVVFSASGLREGWYQRSLPDDVRHEDPLLAAAREAATLLGRDATLPPALVAWTDALFADDDGAFHRRLRVAAAWMSDIGSHDHPEFRAEQVFYRVLRQPSIGVDHHARAFLAIALAIRYDAEPDSPMLLPARLLLDLVATRRAEALGMALRLAYTLSGGAAALLAGTGLSTDGMQLRLRLDPSAGVFAGDGVLRRLEMLAQTLGLEPFVETLGG